MLIQGLGVSLFIFSLANHTAGVPTVITHRKSIIPNTSNNGIDSCTVVFVMYYCVVSVSPKLCLVYYTIYKDICSLMFCNGL